MRLRNLFEALGKEVAVIFGRFNPPHKGHRAAWELASQSPIWYVGTNQSTQGPKDPLPYNVKVEAMKAIWPDVEGHIVAETGWLTMASMIYEKHGDVTLLCLTDEDWVTKTIQQYNGKEGAHGYYNFSKIEQKPTPRLSSATALRDAVVKGDRDAFTQAAGVSADTPVAGKPFFDLVAEYLLPYQNAPKKTAKKKVAEPVEEGWREKLAALGVAGAMGMSGAAGAADRAPDTKKEPIVATIVIDGEVKKLDLTPKGFTDVRDAEKWIAKFMKDRGIMDWQGKIERGEPGTGRYQRLRIAGAGGLESVNPYAEQGVAEDFFSIDDKIKGKIQNIVSDLSDIPGMWDHKAQTFTDAGMDKLKTVLKNNPKYIKYALNLDYRDYEAEGVVESLLTEIGELTTNYYTLSNGKMVQVTYRPNVNRAPIPLTSVKVSYVDPALKPQGPSFDSTGVPERWDRAPDGVKQAIEKFVKQPQSQQAAVENFADGKNPGRKGLAKRSGVNTKASVSDLRKTAKNSSGEKQRMAHWMANMKAGRAKTEDAAGVGIITKQNTTKDVNKGTLRKMMKAYHLIDSMARELSELTEAPIEMDPSDPMNPMIVGTKSNPGKLQYRMLRAANQLKDLAQRAQGAGASEWDMITRNFDELAMNIGEIKHALDELRKLRSRGGVRSRGIEKF
jgi:hypothetical protein